MRLLSIVLLALVLVNVSTLAQKPIKDLKLTAWSQGQLALNSGEMLKGELNYNYVVQIIRVKVDGKELAFNESQVAFFEYETDEGKEVWKRLKLEQAPRLYRVLAENQSVAFLSYLDIERDMRYYRAGDYHGSQFAPMNPNEEAYREMVKTRAEAYVAVTSNGKVTPLGRISERPSRDLFTDNQSTISKKRLIAFLENFDPTIRDFIKKEKLKMNQPADIIRIFNKSLKPF